MPTMLPDAREARLAVLHNSTIDLEIGAATAARALRPRIEAQRIA